MEDTTVWLSIAAFEFACIIFAIALAARRNWRSGISEDPEENPVEHYTQARDELTYTSFKPEVVASDDSGIGFPFGQIIGLVMSLAIFWVLFSTVKSTVVQTMNTTAWDPSMTPFVNNAFSFMPIIMVLGLVFIIVSVFGLGISRSSDDESPKKNLKPKSGIEHYTDARDKLTFESARSDAKREARKQAKVDATDTASMTGPAMVLFGEKNEGMRKL